MKLHHQIATFFVLISTTTNMSVVLAETNEIRLDASIQPNTVEIGQQVRVTVGMNFKLSKVVTVRLNFYQCMNADCTRLNYKGYRNVPLRPTGIYHPRLRVYRDFKVISPISSTGGKIKYRIIIQGIPRDVTYTPRVLTVSATLRTNDSTSPSSSLAISAAGTAARAMAGRSRIQNPEQRRLQRVTGQVLQQLQRERQQAERLMTQTRGGQLMVNLQQAMRNFGTAVSRLHNKYIQCANRSYSREDDRRAGCTRSDTVEQCDLKRVSWCARNERNQFLNAQRRLRAAKEQASRAISGLDACLGNTNPTPGSIMSYRIGVSLLGDSCSQSISRLLSTR